LGKKLVAFLASESREDQRAQDPNGNRNQRIEEFVKTEILEKGLHITDPSEEEIKFLSTADTQPFDYLLRFIGHAISKRAYLGWTTAGHTGVDVNLYAESSQDQDDWILDRLRGNHENTDIGDFLTWYLNLDLEPITKRLVG
jgi:alkaline phosphatase